jgi:Zn-dependent protease with chaperone function
MVTIEKLRVEGEERALYFSLIGVFLLLFLFTTITLGGFLAIVGIVILYIQIKKSRELGSSVLISDKQFPDMYNTCLEVANKLSMPMPRVYIYQSPILNAGALSTIFQDDNGIVVFNSALVEALTEPELTTIIAHEFTHIKCNHTRWGVLTNLHGQYYVPIVSDIMSLVTSFYSRKCETTSDRGGLIIGQNLEASATSLIKLSIGKELFEKMNIEEFIKQAETLEEDNFGKIAELSLTHPHILNRIKYLISFYKSNEYRQFVDGGVKNNRHSEGRKNYSQSGHVNKYPKGRKNY